MKTKTQKQKNFIDYYGFTKTEQKKYPVVTGILKQLTPERIKKEINKVKETKFSPRLEKKINEYEKIGSRDDFVFKWCYKINTEWFLLNVSEKYRESLIEVKTLFNMFIVLIDDISEERNKNKLLNELLKIPFNEECIDFKKLNQKENKYLKFALEIWCQIERTIKKYPYYKKIRNVFEFDVFQFLNAVRYGKLICDSPQWMNETDYLTYFPQSMQIIIDADLDLMCKNLNFKDLWKFRQIILYTQKIARIGNWLTTWEREIKKNDFSSLVFPYALAGNVFVSSKDFLNKNKDKVINKIKKSGMEKNLLKKWEEYYRKIEKIEIKNKSINTKKILSKFKYFLFMHLISQGYK